MSNQNDINFESGSMSAVSDQPYDNGLRPEDFVQLEKDRQRAALLAREGDSVKIQEFRDSAGFLYLMELFMGIEDDEALATEEATNELALALGLETNALLELQDETFKAVAGLEPVTFSETVKSLRLGEISVPQAARQTFNSAPGGISEAEIASAAGVISRHASTGNPLLEVIAAKESAGNYNVVYGGKEINLTGMSINQVLAWQDESVANGADSSAAGKYQIIRKTMRGLVEDMGLSGNERFDEEMQDRMAMKLLEGRGYYKFLKGEISETDFMLRVSKEWASMPKDANGRSYYAGDGLNKAHETPANLIAALRATKEMELNGPVENPTLVASVSDQINAPQSGAQILTSIFGNGDGTDFTTGKVDPITDGLSSAFTLDIITNQGTDQIAMVTMDASTSELITDNVTFESGMKL